MVAPRASSPNQISCVDQRCLFSLKCSAGIQDLRIRTDKHRKYSWRICCNPFWHSHHCLDQPVRFAPVGRQLAGVRFDPPVALLFDRLLARHTVVEVVIDELAEPHPGIAVEAAAGKLLGRRLHVVVVAVVDKLAERRLRIVVVAAIDRLAEHRLRTVVEAVVDKPAACRLRIVVEAVVDKPAACRWRTVVVEAVVDRLAECRLRIVVEAVVDRLVECRLRTVVVEAVVDRLVECRLRTVVVAVVDKLAECRLRTVVVAVIGALVECRLHTAVDWSVYADRRPLVADCQQLPLSVLGFADRLVARRFDRPIVEPPVLFALRQPVDCLVALLDLAEPDRHPLAD